MVHLMILLMELLVLLPAIAKVNGSQTFSQLDYQQVISILGRFNMTRIQ
jgi:hypothetical protein